MVNNNLINRKHQLLKLCLYYDVPVSPAESIEMIEEYLNMVVNEIDIINKELKKSLSENDDKETE